jgi:hypothetical protein
MTRFSLLAGLLLLLAPPALADGLGPRRASDIVELFAPDNAVCPFPLTSATAFSMRTLPDGSTVPFEIPKGRVFVVRHAEIATGGQTPGASALVAIAGGVPPGSFSQYAVRDVTLDASGRARFQIDLNVGFVVPSGGVVCVTNTGGLQFSGTLEGYLVKDK